MSLEAHAERELRMAGFFGKDSEYDGAIGEAVMKLVRVHAAEGHSGLSHHRVLALFAAVADYKTLMPLTTSPDEWMDVSHVGPWPAWQSRRDPAVFSLDGGKTAYRLCDGDHESAPCGKCDNGRVPQELVPPKDAK